MNVIHNLAAFSMLAPFASAAQTEEVVELRAKEVAAIVTAEPKWADDLFDPTFLQAIAPEKLRELALSLHAQLGKIESVRLVQKTTELSAKFEALHEKNFVTPITISVNAKPPHSVVELWFGAPSPGFTTLEEAAKEFGKLPGSVSFAVCELGAQVKTLAAHEPDRPLAIGSAFKLYVLGALAREVAESRRRFDDVLRLDARYRSLPSGMTQDWPVGAPVTFHTLASLMIAISDNTAADHLLFTLGRSTVEAMSKAMGNEHFERNVPFLSTGELFRMKFTGRGKLATEYLAKDATARRAFLEGDVDAIPLDAKSFDASSMSAPANLDTIEWFASAHDLCRAMDWLRKASEKKELEPVRGILAIAPGLDVSKETFPYVGFKGGSEPGVLNLTYLLRDKAGAWYALSAGWNNPDAHVSVEKLAGLVMRTVSLLGARASHAAEPAFK